MDGAFREYLSPELIEMLRQRGMGGELLPDTDLGPVTPRTMSGLPNDFAESRDPTAGELVGGGAFGAVLDYGAMPAQAYADQAGRAVDATQEAMTDPSVMSVGNALVQSGLLAPTAGGLKTASAGLGAGYGAALGEDLGLFDGGAAQAQEAGPGATPLPGRNPLRPSAAREVNASREQELELARIKAKAEAEGRAAAAEASERAKQEGLTERESAARADAAYNERVTIAKAELEKEMQRDWRFSDTWTGKYYKDTGGIAAALAPLGAGALHRMGVKPTGKALQDYGIPWLEGLGAAYSINNMPTIVDALFTESENPRKRAYESYAFNLPEGHPDKQRYAERAVGMPDKNPVKQAAQEDFFDPTKQATKVGLSGIEAINALLGAKITGGSINTIKKSGDIVEEVGSLPRRFMDGYRGGPRPQRPGAGTPLPANGPQNPAAALGSPGRQGQAPAQNQAAAGNAGQKQLPPPQKGQPSPPPGNNKPQTPNPPSGRYAQNDRDLVRNVMGDMVEQGRDINKLAASSLEKLVNTGRRNKIPTARIKELLKNTKEYLKTQNKITGDTIKSMPTRWKGKDLLSIAAVGGAGAVGLDQALEELGKGRLPGSSANTTQTKTPKDVKWSDALLERARSLGGR